MSAAELRAEVRQAMEAAGIFERRACWFTGFARSSKCYRTRCPARGDLRERLHTLATLRPRWGYRRLHLLLEREGHEVNQKFTYRFYREERLRSGARSANASRCRALRWLPCEAEREMELVSDALADGPRIQELTSVNDFTRESPAIAVDFSVGCERVVRILEQLRRCSPD